MNNQNQKGQIPNSTMRTGAVIAIVSSSIVLIIAMICSIIIFVGGSLFPESIAINDTKVTIQGSNLWMAILFLLLAGANIASLVLNIMLLKGQLNSQVWPAVLAILSSGIGILGIVAGVLILIGQFENQKPESSKGIDLVVKEQETVEQEVTKISSEQKEPTKKRNSTKQK